MKFFKRCFLATVLLITFLGLNSWAALTPAESDKMNGYDAPGFSATTVNGKTVSLEDYKGQPILLNFFASWCPPCRQEIGELLRIDEKYASSGLAIIGAATDSKLITDTPPDKEKSDVTILVSRLKILYPVFIADQSLVQRYQFIGIPTIIFITAEGKIAKVFYGYHNMDQIEKIIQSSLLMSPIK